MTQHECNTHFCDADDFCQKFIPEWKKARLEGEEKTPTRAGVRSVCESEIIALVVCYHLSGYRTFKCFYLRFAKKYLLADFPGLPSYNRFIELMPDVLAPIAAFMQSRCGKGIAIVDSTPLCVCKNLPFPRHKTFRSVIPAWISGIQATWTYLRLLSLALNARFPAGITGSLVCNVNAKAWELCNTR